MIDDLKLMIRPVGEKGFAVQASTLLGVKSEAYARGKKKNEWDCQLGSGGGGKNARTLPIDDDHDSSHTNQKINSYELGRAAETETPSYRIRNVWERGNNSACVP